MLENTTPQNIELNIDSNVTFMVKADRTGTIEYTNLDYAKLSEYGIAELIGKDISALIHPDMPSAIFNHIWESLFKKERAYAIFKNISKTGKYFWLQVNIDFKVNEETREIENIYAYYSKTSESAKKELNTLFKKVKSIETHTNIDIAENYLNGYLDEQDLDYKSLIEKHYIN